MSTTVKTAVATAALALMAAPAFATGHGETPTADSNPGTTYREGAPYSGESNPGTARRPEPPSRRALGRVCAEQGASRSNENDPQPGTPFSRCVRDMASAVRAACADQSKSNEGDTDENGVERPGTPFSRCVSELGKGLRTSDASTARGLGREACRRPEFASGREYSDCVKAVARGLREAR